MANASQLAQRPLRIMLIGYPKSGKTGALACLANAGYNLRVLSFDGAYDPLLVYTEPDKLANIDIATLKDRLKPATSKSVTQVRSNPRAFVQAMELIDGWKYQDGDETVDLGDATSWGTDTVLVIDNLTDMGEAAFNFLLALRDRTGRSKRRKDWGDAMAEQDQFCQIVTSDAIGCHVIMLSHIKMVGPEDYGDDDDEETKERKNAKADVVPFRLYPSALGRELPPRIHRHFPIMLRVETRDVGGGRPVRRVITAVPRPDIDAGAPILGLTGDLPQDTGLLEVFRKRGFVDPGAPPS